MRKSKLIVIIWAWAGIMLPIYRASAKETSVDLSESFIENDGYIHDFNKTLEKRVKVPNNDKARPRITSSKCIRRGAPNDDWKWHNTPTLGVYKLKRTSGNMAAQHSAEFRGNYTMPSDSKGAGNGTEQQLSWKGVLTNPKIRVSWKKNEILPLELIWYGYDGNDRNYMEDPTTRKQMALGNFVQVTWKIPITCVCAHCKAEWKRELCLKMRYRCMWHRNEPPMDITVFTNIPNGIGSILGELLKQDLTPQVIDKKTFTRIMTEIPINGDEVTQIAISNIMPHHCGQK